METFRLNSVSAEAAAAYAITKTPYLWIFGRARPGGLALPNICFLYRRFRDDDSKSHLKISIKRFKTNKNVLYCCKKGRHYILSRSIEKGGASFSC
jgi:hypothetical protein